MCKNFFLHCVVQLGASVPCSSLFRGMWLLAVVMLASVAD